MKGNRKIRKQLQAYLCMLVMAVQSLTPVMQVSAEEVTTVDVSTQAAEAEMDAENASDAVTVSDARNHCRRYRSAISRREHLMKQMAGLLTMKPSMGIRSSRSRRMAPIA